MIEYINVEYRLFRISSYYHKNIYVTMDNAECPEKIGEDNSAPDSITMEMDMGYEKDDCGRNGSLTNTVFVRL